MEVTVALTVKTDPTRFSFSREWNCPRTVLQLSAGHLDMLNIQYLILDNDLSCEDLLIVLPVLRHLNVDTTVLLEQH